jgi:hypothetical protein
MKKEKIKSQVKDLQSKIKSSFVNTVSKANAEYLAQQLLKDELDG